MPPFGHATFGLSASTGNGLIAATDGALYAAKAAGEDRLCVASDPLPAPV